MVPASLVSPPPPSRFCAALLLLLIAACDGGSRDPLGPGGTADFTALAMQQQPFYWFKDTQIPLQVVRGEFVVKAAPSADAVVAARDALTGMGLDVAEARGLIRGHQVLVVAGGDGSPAQTSAIARQLRAHAQITFASPNYTVQADGSPFFPLETFMVKFRDGASPRQIDSLNAAFGVSVVREPGNRFQYHHLRYPESGDRSILEIVAAYHESPLTEWADPTRLAGIEFAGDPTSQEFFGEQWYLDDNTFSRDGVPADINMRPAWAAGFTGAGVKVAVLDSGIDGFHEDFGTVMNGGDFTGMGPGCDPMDPNCQPVGALNPVINDFHGTAVAGIIAALHQTTNVGVAGIAPGVTLYSLRVGEFPSNLAPVDSLAAAIHKAWFDIGADVINGSWGSMFSGAISQELAWAVQQGRNGKGTVAVFSAGNTGRAFDVKFPANDPNAIAVSGLAKDGALWTGSSRGPEIEIAAFSGSRTATCDGEITTTDISDAEGCSALNPGASPGGNENYTTGFSGTSSAAPQVAGAIALLLGNEPGLTLAQVRSRLASSADKGFWSDPNSFGAGKLNVGRLVNAPANQSPTATISSPANGATFQAGASILFSGGATDPEDGTLTGTGLVWQSDLDGPLGTGASFSRSDLSVGVHTITLTATDSGGASDTAQVQITVEAAPPPNQPPTATISSPANGATFQAGASILFSGGATDPEDGTLTGTALVWQSDLDGQIGTGASFTRSDLSVGVHTITLTATDSGGATGTAQVQITVEAGGCPPPQVTCD